MSVIMFFSMVMIPFFWALSRTLSKVCKSMTYPLSFSSSWYVRESFTPPFPNIRIWSDILKQYRRSLRESMDNALTWSFILPSIRKNLSNAPLSIILDRASNMALKSLLYVALSLNSLRNFSNSLSEFPSKQIENIPTLSFCSIVFNVTCVIVVTFISHANIMSLSIVCSLLSEYLV